MKNFLLALILVLIVASCLFPPWKNVFPIHKSNIKGSVPMGYRFIAYPPPKADSIDLDRLGIQVGLLLFLGSCIVFSKHIFPKEEKKSQEGK